MKTKIFKSFVCITGMLAMLLLYGCDKGTGSLTGLGEVGNGATVKQIDISVIVPVHPSSLEYFDYCVFYTDNNGMEYRDTVSSGSLVNDIYWKMSFSYTSLPLLCRCEVRLIPKVSGDSVVSFSYIIPKPYIFSRVFFNSHSTSPTAETPDIEGIEILKIDDIRIDSFMSTYGSTFISTCSVKESDDGISCLSY